MAPVMVSMICPCCGRRIENLDLENGAYCPRCEDYICDECDGIAGVADPCECGEEGEQLVEDAST